MDNKPLSQQFLQVENNSIISGTIPQDNEIRPHVRVSYDDSNLRGQANGDSKAIGIIGPASDGIPNHVYTINSVHQAENVFGSGPLVEAIQLCWKPGRLAYGQGGTIYAERVQDASQATLDAGALHFTSTTYGNEANDTAVRLTRDPLTETWTVDVTNTDDNYHAQYDGIGLLGHIQYIPNAWTKENRPKGYKDYTRATMSVLPRKISKHAENGKVNTVVTGEAAKIVFNIHDTKEKGILHNNITNNLNGGSTVYDSQPYTQNGTTYEKDYEYQTPGNASEGDINPDLGPFQDTTFTVDLTNNKFRNVTDLFNYLQSLPFLNVSIDDDHQLSHINPVMLDLTEHPVNIMGSLDDETQDDKGNVIEPAGIWSTLGDLVDKLRYDGEVHASADMDKQLNIISTEPDDISQFEQNADRDSEKAINASDEASLNSSMASKATQNDLTSLAGEYADVANSESDVAQSYSSLAAVANRTIMSLTNQETSNITSADSSADSVSVSASILASQNSSSLSTYSTQLSSAFKTQQHYEELKNSAINSANSLANQNTSISNYNSDASSVASANSNNPSMAASLAQNYYSLANSLAYTLPAYSAGMSNASSYASQANTYQNMRSSDLNYINLIKSANNSASSDAASAKVAALNSDSQSLDEADRKALNGTTNMKKVQIYIANLIAQIRTTDATNVLNSDLDALSGIAKALSDVQDNVLTTNDYRTGLALNKAVQTTLSDKAQIDANTTGAQKGQQAKKQFDIDLGNINAAANQCNPTDPAPDAIFTMNSGVAQINVLNEPINSFDYTNLTDGYTKPIPADWSYKLKQFNDTPAYDFVALSPHAAVHAQVAEFIGDRYESNHNMRAFVGPGYNASVQELVQRANDIDNERVMLVGTSGDYTIGEGLHKDIPGYMSAALFAGIDSSLPFGRSILNQPIGYNRLDQKFSNNDLNTLDQNGVVVAEPVVNRGHNSEYVIGDDVTTSQNTDDPVKSQLSIGETTDALFDDLRDYLQDQIGRNVTQGSANQIVVDVNAFLHNECTNNGNADGLIVDYNSDDTYCEIHNEAAYIEFSVAPSMPLKYVNVIGTYDGFDETASGGNTGNNGSDENSFQYLDNNDNPIGTDDNNNDEDNE